MDMYDMNLKFRGINNLPVLKNIREIQKKNKLIESRIHSY